MSIGYYLRVMPWLVKKLGKKKNNLSLLIEFIPISEYSAR